MKEIEIKDREDGQVILSGKYESIKDCLEKNRNTDLQGAYLQGAYLQGAYLQGADLQGAYLQGAYLQGADLQGADLRRADLRRADLRRADLRRADLRRADLQGAYLRRADLQGAYLQGAYLRRADLQGAYLQGAYLQGAYLRRADLRRADLQGADLRRADLQGAYLQGADLRRADLQGAYLQGADLQGADLQGAYLQGADLQGALYLPDLYCLKLLPLDSRLRFWKYLVNGKSPYQGFEYEVGKRYTFDDCSANEYMLCARGGNVATLTWCLKDNVAATEFMEVEFTAADIGAIPYGTDGKFRVKEFTVLRIINREEAIIILKDAMKIGQHVTDAEK